MQVPSDNRPGLAAGFGKPTTVWQSAGKQLVNNWERKPLPSNVSLCAKSGPIFEHKLTFGGASALKHPAQDVDECARLIALH